MKVQTHKTGFQFTSALAICLLFISLAFFAVLVFNVSSGTLLFAALALACPLLHVWMMKGGHKSK